MRVKFGSHTFRAPGGGAEAFDSGKFQLETCLAEPDTGTVQSSVSQVAAEAKKPQRFNSVLLSHY